MISGDTIAAISSAVGAAGRMIVRVSGPMAHQFAGSLCPQTPFQAGSARLSRLSLRGLTLPIWLYAFAAPHSYTSEDLVEFHLPGNPLLARLLLDELFSRGARPAEAGEFTARAFFSGRIDLAETEGIAATIAAQNEAELRAARQLLGGELARRLRPAMEALAQTLALVEAGIDFSDEDLTFLSAHQIGQRVAEADAMLREVIEPSARFERLSHEPRAVLVGRPNAGKSTLLNALAGQARAVVSASAGTTRDVLYADVPLHRGLLRLVDVAGLEEPSSAPRSSGPADEVARLMREHALGEIETADLVLIVHDPSPGLKPLAITRQADLLVFTKLDLMPAAAATLPANAVAVSACTGENLAALRDRLDKLAFGSPAPSPTLALNARHVRAIDEARQALARAADAADTAAEILALELREALDALGRVLGSISPDELLGRIFATFCIGK